MCVCVPLFANHVHHAKSRGKSYMSHRVTRVTCVTMNCTMLHMLHHMRIHSHATQSPAKRNKFKQKCSPSVSVQDFALHDEIRAGCNVATDFRILERLPALLASRSCSRYNEAFKFEASSALEMQTVWGHDCKIDSHGCRQLVRDLRTAEPNHEIRTHRPKPCVAYVLEICASANCHLWSHAGNQLLLHVLGVG